MGSYGYSGGGKVGPHRSTMGDEAKKILGHSSDSGQDGDGDEMDPLEAAAEHLTHSVHSKNHKGVAEALRHAFTMMDAEPHKEGPHDD